MTLKNQTEPSLSLSMAPDQVSVFFPFLQSGFMLKTRVGCSVKTLLCEHLGISPEYLEDRIQTIFVNGKPVDDMDSAIIREGTVLALSAAMPGLVGATLRRGVHLAAFRSTLTHQKEDGADAPDGEGIIVMKLFNLLIRELGPAFLETGIWIKKDDLKDFLSRQPDGFWAGCKAVGKDGKEIAGKPPDLDWFGESERILLKILS